METEYSWSPICGDQCSVGLFDDEVEENRAEEEWDNKLKYVVDVAQ